MSIIVTKNNDITSVLLEDLVSSIVNMTTMSEADRANTNMRLASLKCSALFTRILDVIGCMEMVGIDFVL